MPADEELIAECLRTIRTDSSIEVQAITLHWEGVHKQIRKWQTVCDLPSNAREEVIQQRLEEALLDRRFFSVCPECKVRQLNGTMMSIGEEVPRVCMSCAQSNHGVLF